MNAKDISEGNLYKIGQSENPTKRLAQLQTGCPHKLELIASVYSDKWLERRLHKMFFFSKKRGEWFTLTPSQLSMILDYINSRFDSLPSTQ